MTKKPFLVHLSNDDYDALRQLSGNEQLPMTEIVRRLIRREFAAQPANDFVIGKKGTTSDE